MFEKDCSVACALIEELSFKVQMRESDKVENRKTARDREKERAGEMKRRRRKKTRRRRGSQGEGRARN